VNYISRTVELGWGDEVKQKERKRWGG